jgi:Tol biopolymer transport system component/predicted Ser/Thr protein kinase
MSPKESIAHYRILSKLGEGGMGAVYRATDTKLNRDVAIKVLPPAFAEDAARMARFEREAQVLASLNHPNIAAIYGVEQGAIVMELVEGEDLSCPVPVETAIAYARQIAIALEAAHEKGIIHRDLKPANIKVTPDGTVKLLDFGLAKAAEERGASDATISMTSAGMIVGTAAYMSPEQARGKPVDKRADIWSFGVVFAEMLTGQPLYTGETLSDVLAAVLTKDPEIPTNAPPRVRRLIERCLRKDPKLRLRDIGEARLILDEAEPEAAAPSAPSSRRSLLPWVLAASLALTTGWFAYRASRPAVSMAPLLRMHLALPANAYADFSDNPLALSDDGTRIAVSLRVGGGKSQLYTRTSQESKLVPLAGTENAAGPFFSPDGRWIGYFDVAASKLKKIAVEGGAALVICDASNSRGASWGDDDSIVAAPNTQTPLMRVSGAGGTPQPLTSLTKPDVTHRWPQVLPGSRAVIFTSHKANADYDNATIDVILPKTGERRTLVQNGFFGRYVPSGHLLYLRQSILFAVPFDVERLAVTGPAAPIVTGVFNTGSTGALFAVSRTGLMIYVSGTNAGATIGVFSVDQTGKKELIHSTRTMSFAPRYSPDGKRLAIAIGAAGGADLWVKDLDHDAPWRLTFAGASTWPVWSPDGKGIFFGTFSDQSTPYWIRSDGAGGPQTLSDSLRYAKPYSISPDGKYLALEQSAPNRSEDILIAAIEGEAAHPRLGKLEPFLSTPAPELTPAFSPDGRWIAYSSNESGTLEVFVRPFPGPGGRWQVSSSGGIHPRWAATTHELLYQTPTRNHARGVFGQRRFVFAGPVPSVAGS